MKKSDIKVGGKYKATVSGRSATVRVDAIRSSKKGRVVNGVYILGDSIVYDVTNLATGRKLVFRSAAKFQSEVVDRFQGLQDGTIKPESITEEAIVTGASKPLEGITELLETDPLAETLVNTEEEGEDSADPTHTVTVNVTEVELASSVVQSSCLGLASKIAATRQQRQPGQQVAGMTPNPEQESILEVATQPNLQVLVVAAGAGTGKTATLKMLEQTLPGRGQYTAFSTALVDESKTKFIKAACNTTHSLAFRAIGRNYQHRLGGERMRSHQIARILGIESITVTIPNMGEPDTQGNPTDKLKVLQPDFLAGQVLVAIRKFCQSADREIGPQHIRYIDGIDFEGRANNDRVKAHIVKYCQKAWEDLTSVNGQLPFQHDHYVKLWQLGEGKDRPIISADYILLDEAQDTAPVFLDILKKQTHALLILVGDDNQQIYEWRGAVNAMSSFQGAPRRLLSQSYRFGQTVADVANSVLRTLEEPTDLVMKGLPTIPSRVDRVPNPRCYLYRTNAGAVARVMTAVSEKKRPHLIGGSEETVKWCQAALDLQAKRGTRHPELCCFDTWEEVVEYSKTDEGSDTRLMVKLIEKFGAQAICDALKNMPEEKDADLVISTAHRSKGREWDTVALGPDFPLANQMGDADRRLLYVAATRAKLILDISACPPFCGGKDRVTGEWVDGLRINYTVPMPTEDDLAAYRIGKFAPDTRVAPQSKSSPEIAPAANVGETKPIRQATESFIWANFSGRWCIRGPKDAKLDQQVIVKRKDGSTSQVTLRTVVRRFDDAWIYGT